MNPFRNSILILAAGKQERWNPGTVLPKAKQLLKVGGETLLERMARQFHDPIVFTNHPDIQEHFVRCYEPRDSLTTVSTLHSTKAHWREWTTILLGDVMYSRQQVKRLARQKEKVMFYGDEAEIYCLKFHEDVRKVMAKAIRDLTNHVQWEEKYGKLWNLYRILIGVDYRDHYIGSNFTWVGDCRDFDTREEYLNYVNRN